MNATLQSIIALTAVVVAVAWLGWRAFAHRGQPGCGASGCAIYTDFDELLKDERIQVLSICSPSSFHVENGVQAMAAGWAHDLYVTTDGVLWAMGAAKLASMSTVQIIWLEVVPGSILPGQRAMNGSRVPPS